MKKISFLLILLMPFNLSAAEVVKKIKKKKYIVIDEGSSDGVSRGDRICFYKSSGKKAGCGKAKKVKKRKSYIKVSSKTYRRIKKGYSTESSRSSKKRGGLGLYVKANYIVTPLASSTYNIMVYNTPVDGEPINSLWTNDGSGGTSFVGFGGEVGYYLMVAYLAVGAKYKMISPANITSNYYLNGLENPDTYALTSTSASSIGFYFDGLYPVIQSKKMIVNVGGGLDIDMSSVNVISDQLSDTNLDELNPLYTIDSSGMIISLRVRAELNYMIIKNLYVNGGGVLLVGLAGTPAATIEALDPNISLLDASITAEEDASIALNHTSSFGVEIVFGVSYYL